ncbi:MAG TPA: diadenylate cyclase CdaA [Syntrophomonadaceae bacterium]|nr:diadenylate cyclase CdaA [Syntrophomonadaceae bacterium]
MDLSFLSGIFASPWSIIRSLLDIAIVSYVFYRILRLVTGTRAEQLLKGLVLLLAFSAVASFLRFEMINWLVGKLWILFAITLPIVFQPELRRLLEQIGRGGFFTPRRSAVDMQDYDHIIDEISEAVAILSRNKVGALIILARETGISEYMESGVELDALVTSSLLINIFVLNSPLHDGAVVISEGRLGRASCFLPLSDNPSLEKSLGTRHRAGLGITEVSDAVAIIVSEETGTISIAMEGKLQPYLDVQSMQDTLTRAMVNRPRRSDTFRRRWTGEKEQS